MTDSGLPIFRKTKAQLDAIDARSKQRQFGMDAFDEYGALKAANLDYLANSINLPTAIQDRMGIEVFGAMEKAYGNWAKTEYANWSSNLPQNHPLTGYVGPAYPSFPEFLSTRSQPQTQGQLDAIYKGVQNQPVSQSWNGFMNNELEHITPKGNSIVAKVGEWFSDIGNKSVPANPGISNNIKITPPKTVGDIVRGLASSFVQPTGYGAAKLTQEHGVDYANTMSVLLQGVFNGIISYNPWGNNGAPARAATQTEQLRPNIRSLADHVFRSGRAALSNANRSEVAQSGLNIPLDFAENVAAPEIPFSGSVAGQRDATGMLIRSDNYEQTMSKSVLYRLGLNVNESAIQEDPERYSAFQGLQRQMARAYPGQSIEQRSLVAAHLSGLNEEEMSFAADYMRGGNAVALGSFIPSNGAPVAGFSYLAGQTPQVEEVALPADPYGLYKQTRDAIVGRVQSGRYIRNSSNGLTRLDRHGNPILSDTWSKPAPGLKQAFLTKDDVNNLIAFDQKNQGVDDLPRGMQGPRTRKADALFGAKRALNVARGVLVGGANPNTDEVPIIDDSVDARTIKGIPDGDFIPEYEKPDYGPDGIYSEDELDANPAISNNDNRFVPDTSDYIGDDGDFSTRITDGELAFKQNANYDKAVSIMTNRSAKMSLQARLANARLHGSNKLKISQIAKVMPPEFLGEQVYQASGKSIGWNSPYYRKYPAVPFAVGKERATKRRAQQQAAQQATAAVSAAIQNAPEISNDVENNPPTNFGDYSNTPQASGGGSGDQPPIDNVTTETPPMDDNFNRGFGNAQRPSRKPRSQAVPQVSDFGNADVPISERNRHPDGSYTPLGHLPNYQEAYGFTNVNPDRAQKNQDTQIREGYSLERESYLKVNDEQKAVTAIYKAMDDGDGNMWWVNNDHMRDAAATIAMGRESREIFKVKGQKDYQSGVIRDESGRIVSQATQADYTAWKEKEQATLVRNKNLAEANRIGSLRAATDDEKNSWIRTKLPNRASRISEATAASMVGNAIGNAGIQGEWNLRRATERNQGNLGTLALNDTVSNFAGLLAGTSPDMLGNEANLNAMITGTFPELANHPQAMEQIKQAYAVMKSKSFDNRTLNDFGAYARNGFTEAQQALDRRMGLGMDDAKLSGTLRDAASTVITGFNKGAAFKKFNKSGEGLIQSENADGETEWSLPGQKEVILNDAELERGVGMAKKAVATAFSKGNIPTNGVGALATIKSRKQDAINDELADYAKELDADKSLTNSQRNSKKDRMNAIVSDVADTMIDKAEKIVTDALGEERPLTTAVNHLAYKGHKYTSQADLAKLRVSNPEFDKQFREQITSGITAEEAVALPKGSEINMLAGDEPIQLGGFGGGAYDSQGQRGGMGKKFWQGPMGAAFYGSYLIKRLWGMTAGPQIQAAEKFAKDQGAVGIASGEASGIGGAASRLSLNEDAKGKSSYEVFGGFLEASGAWNDKGGFTNRMGSYASMGAMTAGIASIAPGMLSAMPGIAGSALGTALTASAIPTIGLVAGATMIAGGLALEGYNAWVNPDKNNPASIGSIWQDMNQNMLAARTRAAYVTDQKLKNPSAAPQLTMGWDANVMQKQILTGEYAERSRRPGSSAPAKQTYYGFAANVADNYIPDQSFSVEESDLDWLLDENGKVIPERAEAKDLSASQIAQLENMGTTENQAKINDLAGMMSTKTPETISESKNAIAALANKVGIDAIDADFISKVSDTANANNTNGSSIIEKAFNYANAYSSVKNPDKFMSIAGDYLTGATDQGASYKLDTAAAMRSQVNAQLQGIMPLNMEYDGLGKNIAGQYGFSSQADIGRFSSISASLQAYNDGDLTPMQYQMSASLTNQLQNYQTGAASGFLQRAGAAGVNQMQAMGAVSGLITTMSPQQAQIQESFNNMDWKGMSWAANQAGTSKYAMYDASGRDVIQHSGNATFAFMKNWQSPTDGIDYTNKDTFSQSMLGTDNAAINAAFQDSGMFGLQRLSAQKSFEASMASAGVSFAGIALQEKFNWGSGTWNNPGANSMWGMQDKQRAMSYNSQQADFAAQQWQMQHGNEYSIAQEGIQASRMQVGNDYTNWSQSFNYNAQLQQRSWTQQDWGYQDQTRSLNWSYSMDDINEAIRFAKGRDRRRLETQKERMTTGHNMESEQIDTTRERQEQVWAQEDERYQKQVEYTRDLQDLDQKSFDLNKSNREENFEFSQKEAERKQKEYEEQFKLETEMTKLQREYAKNQLDLQKQAAGIQAQAAIDQKEIQDAQIEAMEKWEEKQGKLLEDSKYDVLMAWNSSQEAVASALGNVNPATIQELIRLILTLGSTNSAAWRNSRNLIEDVVLGE